MIRFLLRFLNTRLRRDARITKLLFGVAVEDYTRIQWDFTTIALRMALPDHIHDGDKVLEMGAGPYALLSVFLGKHKNCTISACDINPDYVRNAGNIAILNDVPVKLFQSDLFDSVDQQYHRILFNAVYIPWQTGIRAGIDCLHTVDTDWCGGQQGHETIERFLEHAPNHLHPGGTVLLGFNPHYLEEHLILRIAERYALSVRTKWSSRLLPSIVIVFEKEQS